MNLTLLHRQQLQGIPSASGITMSDRQLYVAGDNSPWLYQLNRQFEVTARFPLLKDAANGDSLIAKANKPDFEALESLVVEGKQELILFGSGSLSPQRDVLIRINPTEGHVHTYSLTAFYNQLRELPVLQGHELNIEAVAIAEERLFLFNRGKNVVFIYSLPVFLDFLQKGSAFPMPGVLELELPELNGVKAGISGAAMLQGSTKIVFTASVENTPNAIDDGEVLGSFVGIIDINAAKRELTPDCVLIEENGQPLRLKVESVVVLEQQAENEAQVFLVSDSDGGHSEILRVVLRW